VTLTMPKASHSLALVAIAMLATFRLAAATPLAIHIHSEQAMFQVLVSPGTVGSDSFVLQLMSSDGNLLRVKEATLTLSLPERGIEPLPRKATLGADGYWLVPRGPDTASRPLARTGRGPDRLPEDHTGRRLRRAGALKNS
jgi:hypothetical protein